MLQIIPIWNVGYMCVVVSNCLISLRSVSVPNKKHVFNTMRNAYFQYSEEYGLLPYWHWNYKNGNGISRNKRLYFIALVKILLLIINDTFNNRKCSSRKNSNFPMVFKDKIHITGYSILWRISNITNKCRDFWLTYLAQMLGYEILLYTLQGMHCLNLKHMKISITLKDTTLQKCICKTMR